jgi:ribonucleotide monophosphatase NagD (HAD superfamily)
VAALERFKARGGTVVLMTNSPRPSLGVAGQVEGLGAPRSCWDIIVSSGDAAQDGDGVGVLRAARVTTSAAAGLCVLRGRGGAPLGVERVALEEAEGIVCTGLFDDRTETPEDYRATILYGKTKGLKLLAPTRT